MERKTLDQLKFSGGGLPNKEKLVVTEKDHPCGGCGEMIPAGSSTRSRSYREGDEFKTWYGHYPNCNSPKINTTPKEEQPDLFEK